MFGVPLKSFKDYYINRDNIDDRYAYPKKTWVRCSLTNKIIKRKDAVGFTDYVDPALLKSRGTEWLANSIQDPLSIKQIIKAAQALGLEINEKPSSRRGVWEPSL